MRQAADRAYLSLAALTFLAAQKAEAPGGRGDEPGEGGGLAVVIGIAVAFLVTIALVYFLLRARAGKRTNPGSSPKSPRGRRGV